MQYVLFDLETTCWETNYPKRNREVIEVGAVILDSFGNEMARFEQIVRPIQHPHLSHYCKSLTGIEQYEVDSGISFDAFHRAFKHWYESYEEDTRTFVAWGHQDELILTEACEWYRLEPILDGPYLDVKKAFHSINKLEYRIGLLKALKREGLEFEGTHHRALPDTLNLARLFRKYLGEWPV